MSLPLIALLPFVGAVLAPLLARFGRTAACLGAGAATLTALTLLFGLAPAVFQGQTILAGWDWVPAAGLHARFWIDGLGLLFAGLILGIGVLIILYTRYYLSPRDSMGRFLAYLMLFQGAMTGLVLADNVILLLIFWELTSLSSFLLIGFWTHTAEGRQGARMALTVTGAGGLAMIGGVLILADIAGSMQLSEIIARGDVIRDSPGYVPALLLILLGCFAKSAQFPLHFWLPHAMAAPTPVSAYLHSATMVKAGIFLMARLWPVLSGTPEWFYIVTTVGLITMVTAAVIALFKDDLKALLAFSTVSHLGLITMLLGFGGPMAAVAAVFHILNHATFKASLFMVAGIVDHEAGTRNLRRLGGLMALMPVTAGIAAIAAASMAGLPPLNGFLSKEMMLEEAAHTAWAGFDWLVPAAVLLGTVFSVAYPLRLFFHTFWGPARDDYPHAPHDPPVGMWIGPAFLVALVVAIGFLPGVIAEPLVRVAADAVLGATAMPDFHLKLWHGFTIALWMSVAAVLVGIAVLRAYPRLLPIWERRGPPAAKPIFDAVIGGLTAGARALTGAIHTGSLQRQVALVVGAALVLGTAAFVTGSYGPGTVAPLPVSIGTITIFSLLFVATAMLLHGHGNRFHALMLVGVIGLVVALAFIYFSAPDLALTQITVEVVTTVLFLLALNLLPKTTPSESGRLRRLRDLGLATLSGAGVGFLAWAVMTRGYSTIADYFIEHSKPDGGGTNVVNVILVDFRGFDTFGEISVLAIAGLAMYALLQGALSGPAAERLRTWVPDRPRAGDPHPLMLVIVTRIMLPLALLLSVFILLRGHNAPGGGFIAGLLVAIALIMQYMASGHAWAARRMPVDFHLLIGGGLLIAGGTGIGAWFTGHAFLTSDFGYFHLPLFGEFELATAMAFDIGVFLTVCGTVLLALASLSTVSARSEAPAGARPIAVEDRQSELPPGLSMPDVQGRAPVRPAGQEA